MHLLLQPYATATLLKRQSNKRLDKEFTGQPILATKFCTKKMIKAKFHYASWFEAGSKLVADRFEAKFRYAIWFEPASNQLRTN